MFNLEFKFIDEEAKFIKLQEKSEKARIEANEIFKSIGIRYIIHFYIDGGCIKFFKDGRYIKCVDLNSDDSEIRVNFCLLYYAKKLKERKRFKTLEDNNLITNLLLSL